MEDSKCEDKSAIDFDSLVLERNPFNTSGGFGDVYKAQHPKWGLLALKRPRGMGEPGSACYRHLLHEAALWRAARHPNVLRFLGAWEANNTVYLASLFLDNGTVMQYIATRLDADRTKFILDVAKGLSFLHDIDIVHGDIKGNNILVTASVDAVVADFGLAKLADSSTVPSLKGAGSLRWQSPEVLRGHSHRTPSSDVYSFGMTIYEILSGTAPFDGIHPFGVITMVTLEKKRPEPKPRLSQSGISYAMQWKAATCAWNDDPRLRPDMREIVRWLESEGIIRGRIRVSCDQKPHLNGYISREVLLREERLVITGIISSASIFRCTSKGTFPRWVCELNNPGYAMAPRKGDRVGTVVVPIPSYGSRELGAAVRKSNARGQAIPLHTSSRGVWIWMTSDDGELGAQELGCFDAYGSLSKAGVPGEERLHPVLFTAITPPPLVFFTDSVQTEQLPSVRIVFEEMDRDKLFWGESEKR